MRGRTAGRRLTGVAGVEAAEEKFELVTDGHGRRREGPLTDEVQPQTIWGWRAIGNQRCPNRVAASGALGRLKLPRISGPKTGLTGSGLVASEDRSRRACRRT